MTLTPAFLDELRARTQLSNLIGRSTKLIRAGREWKACCPFHNEKTPSFTVNDEKGFYHCFGCGAHGDAIRWLTEKAGLPFVDAVKELAGPAGLEVPAADPRSAAKAERQAGLYDVMAAAERWFVEQLAGAAGAESRVYLDGRGVSAEARVRFGIGFAPEGRAKLRAALASFGDPLLIEAGLLVEAADREPYDRFRGRIIFPIRDARGRTIGFGGRILGAGEPKYLNSPETPLFDKGRSLYNIDRAAAASREAGRVVVVEGFLDVIALDGAGIGEVVAPLGTALTEAQLEKLWRLSSAPMLCFDGDAAGQKAAYRAALRALPHVAPARSLGFARLSPGQDPDDLARANGRVGIDAVLGAAEPLVDLIWRVEQDQGPMATPEARAALRQRLLDHVSTIGDAAVRDRYRAEFLSRYNDLWKVPERRYEKQAGRWLPPSPPGRAARAMSQAGIDRETARAVLSALLRFPELLAMHGESIAALPLTDAGLARLRDQLLDGGPQALDPGERDAISAVSDRQAAGMFATFRSLGYSFARPGVDPERARADLVVVIEALASRPGLEAALADATRRLQETGSEQAFEAQRRFVAERERANARLASLAEDRAEAAATVELE